MYHLFALVAWMSMHRTHDKSLGVFWSISRHLPRCSRGRSESITQIIYMFSAGRIIHSGETISLNKMSATFSNKLTFERLSMVPIVIDTDNKTAPPRCELWVSADNYSNSWGWWPFTLLNLPVICTSAWSVLEMPTTTSLCHYSQRGGNHLRQIPLCIPSQNSCA